LKWIITYSECVSAITEFKIKLNSVTYPYKKNNRFIFQYLDGKIFEPYFNFVKIEGKYYSPNDIINSMLDNDNDTLLSFDGNQYLVKELDISDKSLFSIRANRKYIPNVKVCLLSGFYHYDNDNDNDNALVNLGKLNINDYKDYSGIKVNGSNYRDAIKSKGMFVTDEQFSYDLINEELEIKKRKVEDHANYLMFDSDEILILGSEQDKNRFKTYLS
jgi:hypothetical protein